MALEFKFKEERSSLFGKIQRPIAQVSFKHTKTGKWRPVTMIVDTGADYTLLPYWYAPALGIDLVKDCKTRKTSGVGGDEAVYVYKGKILTRLGEWERKIPVGFLGREDVPPLLGRKNFLDTFAVLFFSYRSFFDLKPDKLLTVDKKRKSS